MKKVQKTIFRNQEEQKLEQLVEKSSRVIFTFSTIFPFDFFPDDLIISENQIDLVIRDFFFSEHIETIWVKDIQQISVETSVLFATLTISLLKPESRPIVLHHLSRSDALLARRIICGLMMAAKENIKLSTLDTSTLIHKLEMIGKDYD